MSSFEWKNFLIAESQDLDPSVHGGLNTWFWLQEDMSIVPKICDYLQYLQFRSCMIESSDIDSDSRIRFFRAFRNFWVPGFEVRKTLISRDKKDFWKFVVILAIFRKSTIFQCPLKSVDECWHWRYKKIETVNHFINASQKIM